MKMRWLCWKDVPTHITARIFTEPETALDIALHVYWYRNTPSNYQVGKTPNERGTILRRSYDHRTYMAGSFLRKGKWVYGWVPLPYETQDCCKKIRISGSKIQNHFDNAYTWAYWNHCKTIKHIASIMDVPWIDLLRAIRADLAKTSGNNQFDAVRCPDCKKFAVHGSPYCDEHKWEHEAQARMEEILL